MVQILPLFLSSPPLCTNEISQCRKSISNLPGTLQPTYTLIQSRKLPQTLRALPVSPYVQRVDVAKLIITYDVIALQLLSPVLYILINLHIYFRISELTIYKLDFRVLTLQCKPLRVCWRMCMVVCPLLFPDKLSASFRFMAFMISLGLKLTLGYSLPVIVLYDILYFVISLDNLAPLKLLILLLSLITS
ncbi:hypothetical protein L9F63_016755, partial [Diploptera punctata]